MKVYAEAWSLLTHLLRNECVMISFQDQVGKDICKPARRRSIMDELLSSIAARIRSDGSLSWLSFSPHFSSDSSCLV